MVCPQAKGAVSKFIKNIFVDSPLAESPQLAIAIHAVSERKISKDKSEVLFALLSNPMADKAIVVSKIILKG